MGQTVVGLFENEMDAQTAVQELANLGISREHVDVSRGSKESFNASSDKENENGITRFFKNLFGSDSDDADRYSKVSSKGYSIVTVHAQSADQAEEAADILDDCGAVDVNEKASEYGVSSDTRNMGSRQDISDEKDRTINRMEETLEVGKRTEDRGGVRLKSRIVEKPVEDHVRLREENVNVERTNVNRDITDMDKNQFEDQDIELTERAEVPVVNKKARVVEEIKLSKDVTERDETINDSVRHTEVDIDKLDSNDESRGNRESRDNRF
jgi:stress response protein YsnF